MFLKNFPWKKKKSLDLISLELTWNKKILEILYFYKDLEIWPKISIKHNKSFSFFFILNFSSQKKNIKKIQESLKKTRQHICSSLFQNCGHCVRLRPQNQN